MFVEEAPWTFERHAVENAGSQGAVTIVMSAVTAGTRIVVKDAVLLQ